MATDLETSAPPRECNQFIGGEWVDVRGVKDTGWGRFGGAFAMEEFIELRWVTVQSGTRPFPF
jgi:acyl-CoA reductase-like NAD-dependent aldehyde dehydrogenase